MIHRGARLFSWLPNTVNLPVFAQDPNPQVNQAGANGPEAWAMSPANHACERRYMRIKPRPFKRWDSSSSEA